MTAAFAGKEGPKRHQLAAGFTWSAIGEDSMQTLWANAQPRSCPRPQLMRRSGRLGHSVTVGHRGKRHTNGPGGRGGPRIVLPMRRGGRRIVAAGLRVRHDKEAAMTVTRAAAWCVLTFLASDAAGQEATPAMPGTLVRVTAP